MTSPAHHILLIGYRGSGKSTIGKRLAEVLQLRFADTDDMVEQTAGKSITEIFNDQGEPTFRDYETQAIRTVVADGFRTVISLGGGAILREENQRLIASAGQVVWLSGSAEQLHQRITQDATSVSRRPSLVDAQEADRDGYAEVVAVLDRRTPIYSSLADFTVQTDNKDPEKILEEVVQFVQHSI